MIKPIGDRVILEPKEIKRESTLVQLDSKDRPQFGKVLVVNDDAPVKIGDVVVYNYYEFDEVNYKGKELLIVKYENLLAWTDDN
jgi:co-chaperonin GroES (HSP10)